MPTVDFYYSIGSRYSYLAASQIAALEADTGSSFVWHPVNSVRLLAARGASPFLGEPVSGQYDWAYRERDASRWAALYGVPFVEPRGRIDFDPELLALACTAAASLGRAEDYSRALFAALFGGEVTRIDEPECVRRAEACGLDTSMFRRALHAAATSERLAATLTAALDAGAFGVPTFVVEGDLFWGNDRLDLLRRRLQPMGRALAPANTPHAGSRVVSRRNAARYTWGEDCEGWHLVSKPDLSVIHERMSPGSAESRHLHHLTRQVFFVLEGALEIETAGETQRLSPHDALEIAPGIPHTVRNPSAEDTLFLVVSSPPSHGDRQEIPSGRFRSTPPSSPPRTVRS